MAGERSLRHDRAPSGRDLIFKACNYKTEMYSFKTNALIKISVSIFELKNISYGAANIVCFAITEVDFLNQHPSRVVHPTGFALGWVGIGWHPTEVLHWVGIRVDTQYPSWSSRVLGIGYQVYYKIGGNHRVLIPMHRQRGILAYQWHCAIPK